MDYLTVQLLAAFLGLEVEEIVVERGRSEA